MNLRFRQAWRTLLFLLVVMLFSCLLSSCEKAQDPVLFSQVDFENSPFKHINNGQIGKNETLPYNIDAITGATVTVEGPGVVVSIPLSMRELENRTEGLVRGSYSDKNGLFIYEGLDLHHLLSEMVEGDKGIILTEKAYRVVLKDSNRADIASFPISDIVKAHQDGRPILLAYGIGSLDKKLIAPFVFPAANPNEKSEGYIPELNNEDGCLKLVYDLDSYGNNPEYKSFTNAAYLYIQEEHEPGFKHTKSTDATYNASRYTDYIITFRGEALGAEMNFTVRQLEDLVTYSNTGKLIKDGIGHSDFYSLANNAYWYVNQYEGLNLYHLLLYFGMKDAEAMGLAKARTTLVSFIANDGIASPESFSIDTLSYPDAFGFYNKNAVDPGDGSYKPTNADLVRTGYPVLLAYGVNNYPYTITSGDDGYISGLSNNGGPLRVVFGKTQYNHANGSHQVQYLKDVIVGEDVLYQTHKYTDNKAQNALATQTLQINVLNENGNSLLEKKLTVGEIEDILYGENVDKSAKKAAIFKGLFQSQKDASSPCHVYEGIQLSYFLMEVLHLPGTTGTITLVGTEGEVTLNLDEALRKEKPAALVFAKNGAPMVSDTGDGYVKEIPLQATSDTQPGTYTIQNDGGPLAVLVPTTEEGESAGIFVPGLTHIQVNLVPDPYAHIKTPYQTLANHSLRLFGEGLERERVYTVSEIEGLQAKIKTLDFSMLNSLGEHSEQRYRGIALYDLFTETGIKSNAGEVIFHTQDGALTTIPLLTLKKKTYQNQLSPEKPNLFAMLAYGKGMVNEDSMAGFPLVVKEGDEGYLATTQNTGGPLRLIIPQESASTENSTQSLENVVAIEVTANQIDTWGHQMSDIYSEFLEYKFTLIIRNSKNEWSHVFTLAQLEAMTDLIVRDTYTVLDVGTCEGLDLWKFVKKVAGSVPGIDNPISVSIFAEDGYQNDLLSVFYQEGLELGIANEDGVRKPLLLAYSINGLPLVDSENHEGYTGFSGNMGGPLRVIAETVQGASVKYANKLVIVIPGEGIIEINPDKSQPESQYVNINEEELNQ